MTVSQEKPMSLPPEQPEVPASFNDPVLEEDKPFIPAETSQPAGKAITAVRAGITAATVLPFGQEGVRYGFWALGEAYSHNPVVGAITLGASTLAVEGLGVIAAAPLLGSDASRRFFTYINTKLRRLGYGEDRKLSPVSKATATYIGGSVVAMAIEQREDPDRNRKQNFRFGMKNAGILSGVLAAQGAAMAEGVDVSLEHPVGAALTGTALLGTGLGHRARKHKRLRDEFRGDPEVQDISYLDKIAFGLTTDRAKLAKIADLERKVWHDKGYGVENLDGYQPYIDQSITFGAFNLSDESVGLVRMFGGKDKLLPPFMEMPFYDPKVKEAIAQACRNGDVEELGTLAKREDMPIQAVSKGLWRLAYRNARERNVKSWGIIMEPERVQKMNERYHFTFKQLGPAELYQGDYCAPFIMDLQEVDDNMRQKARLMYRWFVKSRLKV